ncbi:MULTISPECIES: hypothetical protein [Maribacter]|uniref:Uncharacterized protein n=1 Tax=Maribacter flavus TaxID=1658664 RepID=A0ABU7IIS3_9FLAO|nr:MULTISPECIES: hypothetical protein [Maribacter]MDC6405869.1 hypothetical protein [Maribacter sp. PR66]MEE1972879.1 hypothetical protein [Maribacter flavus]
MEGKARAELKDRILKFLIEDPSHSFTVERLWENLGKPVDNKLLMQEILDEMENTAGSNFLVINNSGYESYGSNEFTQDYLDNGGFTNQYEVEMEVARNMNKSALQDSRIKDMQEKDLNLKIRNGKFSLPISIISVLVAVGSLLYSIFKPAPELKSNDVQIKQLEERLDKIEYTLTKDVDSLKKELYDAEINEKALESPH